MFAEPGARTSQKHKEHTACSLHVVEAQGKTENYFSNWPLHRWTLCRVDFLLLLGGRSNFCLFGKKISLMTILLLLLASHDTSSSHLETCAWQLIKSREVTDNPVDLATKMGGFADKRLHVCYWIFSNLDVFQWNDKWMWGTIGGFCWRWASCTMKSGMHINRGDTRETLNFRIKAVSTDTVAWTFKSCCQSSRAVDSAVILRSGGWGRSAPAPWSSWQ